MRGRIQANYFFVKAKIILAFICATAYIVCITSGDCEAGEKTMQTGYTLNQELVEKTIRYYAATCGRQVDAEGIRAAAVGFTGSFRDASECVDAFRSEIWNAGLVR
jgi:hypothetical protein